MRILFTGSSSFTGYWLIRALIKQNHTVVACFKSHERESYSGVRLERLMQLPDNVEKHFGVAFGSEQFLELLSESNIDTLCHHDAEVRDYKNPDFDFYGALASNSRNVKKIFEVMHKRNLNQFVLTSSVFEAKMGLGEEPHRAFNTYGLSKTLTREVFRYFSAAFKLPLHVFAIPNPFGKYEEPRFINYLAQSWSKGITPSVSTPLYLRDNIPVNLLALAYEQAVSKPVTSLFECTSPQGYVESQGAFAQRCAREFTKRLGRQLSVALKQQTDFTEPMARINSNPIFHQFPTWDENIFWDEYVEFYRAQYPF